VTPKKEGNVRVRLAPSPTGHLHIGTARTALFNWLFARQEGGAFIIRIEDTDRERSKKEYEREILEGLSWLGLHWDEGPELVASSKLLVAGKGSYGPYRQSERTLIYKAYLQKLLKEGKAYWCYCGKEDLEAERTSLITQGLPPKYSGHCRNLSSPPKGKEPQVIRFKTPEGIVEFKDLIRGLVKFDASLFGDVAIAKNLASPLYSFAVVVDDYEMKITHVIRGEDHLSNTPKQILFEKALGFPEPIYAHLPLILSKERGKLSKRYAETSLLNYREAGYLPEAMVNFLALLGWHPRGEEEIFAPEELTRQFNIKKVQKGGAVFNEEKLEWINAQHLKRLDEDALLTHLKEFFSADPSFSDFWGRGEEFLKKVLRLERERMKSLRDFLEIAGFFFTLPPYEGSLLIWNREPASHIEDALKRSHAILEEFPKEELDRHTLTHAFEELILEKGRGTVLWPLRVAVSGRAASPDPFDIIEILGREETLERVRLALEKIRNHAVSA